MNSLQGRARSRWEERDYQVSIQYLGRLQIAVTGTVTGVLYRFTPIDPVQRVDSRDAFYLLASQQFGVAP